MPRFPKIFYARSLHFVSTTVEEDIMLPPNALIDELIKKCLAQAMELCPVEISHFEFSGTGLHMMVNAVDPKDVADFMERFKSESAHALNRLLGRKKRTIWCEGYDSPLIEEVATAIEKIAYIYANPAQDGLADTIDHYAGLSSWQHFKRLTTRTRSVKRYETRYLPRSSFSELPKGLLLEKDYRNLRRKLIHKKRKNSFEIDSNIWMQHLGVEDPKEMHEINQRIIERTREREQAARELREAEGRTPMPRKQLVNTPIGFPYRPDRKGKKMLLHSVYAEYRKKRIPELKALIGRGKEVQQRWRIGDMKAKYPLGLFPPTNIRLGELISSKLEKTE